MLALDNAALAALLTGSILYGVHLVTFGNAVHVLLLQKRRQARRPILIAATFLFFLFGTLFTVFSYLWVQDAFVAYKGPGGATAKLLQISGVVPQLVATPLTAQMLVGDAMLIYRCLVLYQRNWLIVVLPILCWLGTAVLGVRIIVVTAQLNEQTTISNNRVEPMIIAMLSLTVAVNTFCTSMIVYKIWRMRRRLQNVLQDSAPPRVQYGQIITVLVESTAMYSTCAIMLLILEILKTNAAYILYHATIQIVGIAFNVLTIRIDQGRSIEAAAISSDASDPRSHLRRTRLSEMSLRDIPIVPRRSSSEDVFSPRKPEDGQIDKRPAVSLLEIAVTKEPGDGSTWTGEP
ncbi:hypothetical protein FA95DRAFT_1608278 [Auriscalpium vulgare]|uniref:Uncharacterized protein n=1 Tax=Auriscalpium vulgare TaxID=40419 RepID=A0ACB8RM28_9AGAM|nr:hypothetical protein FA95DRAFT_1608278 [Auriscalpium vulgare]